MKSDNPENPDYVPSVFDYNSNVTSSPCSQQRLQRYNRLNKRKRTSSLTEDGTSQPNNDCHLDLSDIVFQDTESGKFFH